MDSKIVWEDDSDKFTKVTQCVVDGLVEGYYREEVSDPGVYVVYAYNRGSGNYVNLGPFNSEAKARKKLEWLCEPY